MLTSTGKNGMLCKRLLNNYIQINVNQDIYLFVDCDFVFQI